MSASRTTAVAIIGAAYGDEGKGLLTGAFAAHTGPDTLVVRFNGGAQAGHTVTLADGRGDGKRHVFHHVGSGSFAGAATYLSRFFVANPILLRTELAELAALGVHPKIAIDPDAPVTLPFDMMINQIVERFRGNARHGSCGMGIGETVERGLNPQFALAAKDLGDVTALRALLARVKTDWVPVRLARLGVASLTEEDHELLDSSAIANQWLADVAAFRDAVAVMPPPRVRHIVFEGAQGLLLDQDRGAFPYVTRSNTGLKNVIPLARDFGVEHLDIVYATRAYTTRHGAGPLAHELPEKPYPGIVDATNIANPWQGTLRFGTLYLDLLARTIGDDLSDLGSPAFTASTQLAVTCLDQVGGRVGWIQNGVVASGTPAKLAAVAARVTGAERLIASHGPTRATLEFHDRLGSRSSGQASWRASSEQPLIRHDPSISTIS